MGDGNDEYGASSFITDQIISDDETYENMSYYDQQSADGLERLS